MTLGYDSGETEIFSVDQDLSTGFFYIAGTSTAKELKASGASKSVFMLRIMAVLNCGSSTSTPFMLILLNICRQ